MPIEAKIFAREGFGDENDLGRMLRKMLDHVEHGRDAACFIALDVPDAEELFAGEVLDDDDGFVDGRVKTCRQRGAGFAAACIELEMPDSFVFSAAESGDDPLADVAGEMHGKIGRGILRFGAAHPDLVIG